MPQGYFTRSLVTIPATASAPASTYINTSPLEPSAPSIAPPASAPVVSAPPLVPDTKMDCSHV